MLGKTMNEFRRTTDDFKETWAREVDFEQEEKQIQPEPNALSANNSVNRSNTTMKNEIIAPEIRAISEADFQTSLPKKPTEVPQKTENKTTEKHDWL